MLVIDYLVLNIATVKFFHLCVSLISKYNNNNKKKSWNSYLWMVVGYC